MKFKVKSISLLVLLSMTSLIAEDWPQYLGPDRNATSAQKGLIRSWPQAGPEVLWTVAVGRGFGGPVVKDGKVYLLDRDDEKGEHLTGVVVLVHPVECGERHDHGVEHQLDRHELK